MGKNVVVVVVVEVVVEFAKSFGDATSVKSFGDATSVDKVVVLGLV